MKITYIRTQFWFNLLGGGSVGHTIGVLSALKKYHYELNIISNDKFVGIEDYNYSIIKPFLKKPAILGEFLYNIFNIGSIQTLLQKQQPDFIYHRYSRYSFIAALLAKKMSVPLILEYNGSEVWKIEYWKKTRAFFGQLYKKVLKFLVKKNEYYNLKNSSLICVVSKVIKQNLIKNYGINANKIVIMPNGVSFNKFNKDKSNSKKSKKIINNLKLNQKIKIGFVGTFGQWHGIPELVKAVKLINNKANLKNKAVFLLIGDGKLKKWAQKFLKNQPNVFFLGLIPYKEIEYYLAICDIVLSPHCRQADQKKFFGSPTKLFEYMAMEKAIIASKVGQIAEVLTNNENAILVEPGNIEELAKAIERLINNPKLIKVLAKNAFLDAKKNHSWISKFLVLHKKLINLNKIYA